MFLQIVSILSVSVSEELFMVFGVFPMLIFKSALLFTFFAFFFEESSALVEAFDKTSFLLRCIFRSLPSKVKENVKKPSPSTLLTAAIDILVVKQRENLTDLMQTGNYNEFQDFSQ